MNFKTLTRFAVLSASALALSACASNYDVAGTKALPSKGGAFEAALQQKYADFVSWEQQEGDWNDSVPFLNKAKAAANGEDPATDPPVNAMALGWKVKVDDFVKATKATDPVRAATAQVAYDCLNHEASEGDTHPADYDAHGCKKIVADAILPPSAPVKPIISTALPAPFIVYFGFNKYDLDADANQTIADAAKAIAKYHVTKISVEGNTDTVGSGPYNMTLSQKRADVVEKALTGLGVPAADQQEKAFGKTHLKVATPDQTKEPRNRRVEIHLEQ